MDLVVHDDARPDRLAGATPGCQHSLNIGWYVFLARIDQNPVGITGTARFKIAIRTVLGDKIQQDRLPESSVSDKLLTSRMEAPCVHWKAPGAVSRGTLGGCRQGTVRGACCGNSSGLDPATLLQSLQATEDAKHKIFLHSASIDIAVLTHAINFW
jgi:hypothetical protein